MAKLITAQPKFKLMVANLAGASDPSRGPSGNPVKVRTAFEMSLFPEIPRGGPVSLEDTRIPGVRTRMGLLTTTTPGVPVGATGTITVGNNSFAADATLLLGSFTVTSGDDFAVGGTLALTAVALATAINNLPDFTATALVAVVTVTGPFGLEGNSLRFEAEYAGSVQNYVLSPTVGTLGTGEPVIGPPTIF